MKEGLKVFGFKRRYITPGGSVYTFYNELEKQNHLLVAGCTGSGKSVLEHGLIVNMLKQHTPDEMQLVLIDPKGVELSVYKNTPHCIGYAYSMTDCVSMFDRVALLVSQRFADMQRTGSRLYNGSDVYVFVDEFGFLMTQEKKRTEKALSHIAMLGRAVKVHLILLTQRPTRDVITGTVRVNIDSVIALRTESRQDCYNIIRDYGAESFPRFGKCLYRSPDNVFLYEYDVPNCTDQDIFAVVKHWTTNKCRV